MFYEAMSGEDWRGHRITTLDELLGVDDKGIYLTTKKGQYQAGDPKGGKLRGQTTTFDFKGGSGPLDMSQVPSYLISQLKGVQPIQIQNLFGWLMGEIEGFDAIARSAGLHTSSTYPSKRKVTDDFIEEWLSIKKEGGRFQELRAKVDEYNKRQKGLKEEGIPVDWSSIAKKGSNIYKAERRANN